VEQHPETNNGSGIEEKVYLTVQTVYFMEICSVSDRLFIKFVEAAEEAHETTYTAAMSVPCQYAWFIRSKGVQGLAIGLVCRSLRANLWWLRRAPMAAKLIYFVKTL
jgi:hypothetical protein